MDHRVVDHRVVDGQHLAVSIPLPAGDVRREHRLRRAAAALSVVNVAIFGSLWWAGSATATTPTAWHFLAFAAAFGLVGAVPMRLDFSAHQVTFTLTDAVLVVALFYLSAPWLALAATAGELGISLLQRTPAMKTVFNSASRAGAGAAAATLFALVGGHHTLGLSSWVPALMAAAVWSLLNIATVAGVMARAENRPFEQILARSIPTTVGTSLLGASLGLIATDLLYRGPAYPLLLLPVAAGATLNNRYATAQRDEHLRIERLYEATARTAQLAPGVAALATLADEARRLVTGVTALCCARDPGGEWVGAVSRSDGVAPAAPEDVEQVRTLARCVPRRARTGEIPARLRHLAGDADVLVTAQSPATSEEQLIVAVFRRAPAAGSMSNCTGHSRHSPPTAR